MTPNLESRNDTTDPALQTRTRRRAGLSAAVLLAATLAVGAVGHRLPDTGATPVAGTLVTAGNVHFGGQLDRTAVQVGSDGLVRVELALGADASPTAPARRPTDLVVVLDRSGSMQGQKIDDARAAVVALLSQLSEEDRFSLITFSSDAHTTIPLAEASPGAVNRWRHQVSTVAAGGGTQMSPALDLAFVTLEGAREAQRNARIILISDGLAAESHGILHGQARRAVSGEYVLGTVGVGADFDEDLMASLADIGAGNYYYLEDAAALADVFADEFETARETIATRLEVAIRPARGVEVVEASGYPLERVGPTALFRPGTLFAGQERRVWVTLRVPAHRADEHDLGSFALQFRRDGRIERLALPELPQVASVASEEDFFAGLDVDRWARSVVEEEYGALQQAVAGHVQAGRLDEARQQVQEFRTRNTELNETAASPQVEAQIEAAGDLDASIEDAFEGADQARKRNSLGKAIHAESYLGRRAGSRK